LGTITRVKGVKTVIIHFAMEYPEEGIRQEEGYVFGGWKGRIGEKE